MSHPMNKKDRFLKGKNKGDRRAKNMIGRETTYSPDLYKKILDKTSKMTRHTTKLCSCPMCGNPRKFFNEKTMQEKKFKDSSLEK